MMPGSRYSRINCYAFRSGKLQDISVEFTHFHNRYVEQDDVCSAVESQRISFLSIQVCLRGK